MEEKYSFKKGTWWRWNHYFLLEIYCKLEKLETFAEIKWFLIMFSCFPKLNFSSERNELKQSTNSLCLFSLIICFAMEKWRISHLLGVSDSLVHMFFMMYSILFLWILRLMWINCWWNEMEETIEVNFKLILISIKMFTKLT